MCFRKSLWRCYLAALTQWNMLNTLTIAIPAPPKLERWVAEIRSWDSAEVVGPAAKPRGNEEESQDRNANPSRPQFCGNIAASTYTSFHPCACFKHTVLHALLISRDNERPAYSICCTLFIIALTCVLVPVLDHSTDCWSSCRRNLTYWLIYFYLDKRSPI